MIRYLCLFILSLAGLSSLRATHIVGGEITYKCLGNNNYEITLTVYRDCYNGQPWFDNPARVGVYEKGSDSVLVRNLALPYNAFTNDTLPIVLNNPCLTVPPDVCVHKATYKTTVNLPFNPKGYILVYQRCCRNKLIRNLPDPLNTGISFVAEISAQSQQECNNAATFINWPPVAICIHQPIDFDHAATDPDGDSLSYRLCTPFNGPDSLLPIPSPPLAPPYPELIWQDPPYNLLNLLGGDPLKIDPNTGFMTGVPNMIGNFVVGVCVDEYRNGELLSTTRRDFQYNVADCGQPNAAFFLPEILCDTLNVKFTNKSTNTDTYTWYFDWENHPDWQSTDFSPTFTYPDTGLFTVALIAAPGLPCADTFFQVIQLVETEGPLSVSANPEEIMSGDTSQLLANLPGAIGYSWVSNNTLSDLTIADPLAFPPETSTYTVTALLPNGCRKTGSVTVRVPPPVCAEPLIFFPTGFSPNGDGENDVLQMESSLVITKVYWAVYNRWGERVFEADALDDFWDGTYKGQPQPAETYGFFLRVQCEEGQPEFIKKGNVTLLR
ncbi:MAG TPA: gliding motility-associated C-terminal domain-containing protein [Saprospiraceae bacterium]|nr:gliding motility-associated C-terminal domain-containing protein [Saprospiraceae bacterium]